MTTYASLSEAVFVNIVAPDFRAQVRDVVAWRHRWRKIANWAEGLSQFLVGAGTILAYAAGVFDDAYLSFAAGSCSTACIIMLRYAAYANRESVERNAILDSLLAAAGLGPAPSIAGTAAPAPD